MPAIIEFERLGVTLGGSLILDDLTLHVEGGEVVGVAGANGTGKTTLLRVAATLLTPGRGSGRILGAPLGEPGVFEIRNQIGLLSHVPAVIPELTLEENLMHAIRLAGDDTGRIPAALRVVGLDGASDRRGSASSFGMLRRTEIARLLITRPRLLLLDEAYGGLDSDARSLIDVLIDRTLESGGCCIVVSHDQGQVRRANRVHALMGGALTETL